jgi:thioredoxin-related protein
MPAAKVILVILLFGSELSFSQQVKSAGLVERVDEYIRTNPIMIFSKEYCPYCSRVKQLFTTLGVPFQVLELDKIRALSSPLSLSLHT